MRGRGGWLLAIAVVCAGCAIIAWEARGVTFNADDFQFILDPRPLSAAVTLEPHAQSLSAFIVLAFRALVHVFGFTSYAPFVGLLLVMHASGCLALYALARPRLGPYGALAPVAVLGTLGPAWFDLFFATQVGYIASVAFGFGALLCALARRPAFDAAAAGLLVMAFLWSSVGLGMVVLVGLVLLLEGRAAWRRLWVAVVPGVLYIAWYLHYGLHDSSSNNAARLPGHLVRALGAGVSSATGLGHPGRHPYLMATVPGLIVAALVCALVLARRVRLSPVALAALGAAVTLWAFAALAYYPSREPQQSRYQYPAAALLLLAASGAVTWRPGRRGGAMLGVATAAIVASNLTVLHTGANWFHTNSAYTRAEAGALQIARGVVASSYQPINVFTAGITGWAGFQSVTAGAFFAATERFGSPADSPEAVLRRPERVREAADLILVGAERVALVRAPPGARAGLRCRSAPSGRALGELTLGPGRLIVSVAPGGPAALALRRLAAGYRFAVIGDPPPQLRLPELGAGTPLVATLPRDRSALPWHARVQSARPARACWRGAG